jgi:hypothetical protein
VGAWRRRRMMWQDRRPGNRRASLSHKGED